MPIGNPLFVGVSGHRYLTGLDLLRGSVDTALDRLAVVFPRRPFHVLSSLAEGADRLVAARILQRPGARLTAVLPMPKDSYMADFTVPESKEEFLACLACASETVELPARQNRDDCYASAGEYILLHSDVLFAIWDGRPTQGTGGTGAVVASARARAVPLVWLHAGNRVPGGTEPTSLGGEQGQLTFERINGLQR